MVKASILLMMVVMPAVLMAGSNDGLAKIKDISYKSSGALIVEFEELNQGSFMSKLPQGTKKFRFEYLKWPKGSRYATWWYKLTPWSKVEEAYKPTYFLNLA